MHELDNPVTLDRVLASIRQQLGVQDIKKVGYGNEFYIFRADLPTGPAVIKIPKDKVFSNVNDNYIDSQTLLDQEFALLQYVRKCGMAEVPEPISQLSADSFGAVVMSYIPSDDSIPDQRQVGALLARIHGLPPPPFSLSAQEGLEIPELISRRLTRRWHELHTFIPDLAALPGVLSLVEFMAPARTTKQLLHMDFRRANFRTMNGDVSAVLDWSNALVGHPALELARVAETGETDADFLAGYMEAAAIPPVTPLIDLLFRLDSATMLALVFLSEDPDPVRAELAVARVRELSITLQDELQNRP
jgi:aminoglycoside phosphotransferase (APT) family kinase protein